MFHEFARKVVCLTIAFLLISFLVSDLNAQQGSKIIVEDVVLGRTFTVMKDSQGRIERVIHDDFVEVYGYDSEIHGGRVPYSRAIFDVGTQNLLSAEVTQDFDRISRQITAREMNMGIDAREGTVIVWDYRWQSPVEVKVKDSNGDIWTLKFLHNRDETNSTFTTFKNNDSIESEKALNHFRKVESILSNRFKRWATPYGGS